MIKIILKRLATILLVIILFSGLIAFANYVFTKVLGKKVGHAKPNISSIQIDKSKEISLQEVNNLGYTFYLGEIDNSNSIINDNLKNEITKIIYDSKFPKSLLKNTAIIVVNSLAIKPNQYIKMGNTKLNVYNFSSSFVYEGGIFEQYSNGQYAIYINKDFLINKKMSLKEILTHELGHIIGSKLTTDDWKKYYSLRNIPTNTELDKNERLWNLSPREDFAEVYKNTFTNLEVRTFYGYLKPTWEYGLTCGNEGSQSCKIKVLSNPEKYPDDFKLGSPYENTIDQKTKDFIKSIIDKLNK